jgi:hypothetical protein
MYIFASAFKNVLTVLLATLVDANGQRCNIFASHAPMKQNVIPQRNRIPPGRVAACCAWRQSAGTIGAP